MQTWLVVAAEAREFSGILQRAGSARGLDCPQAEFAQEIVWKHGRWLLLANGPGPKLVERALGSRSAAGWGVDGLMSIGFCGALDPALRVGDIVVSGDVPRSANGVFVRGEVLSVDRVAVTAEEKHRLRTRTGAAVVEMESAAVAAQARRWGVPFRCVRAVSDTAAEDLPLDFNEYRDTAGRFRLGRIAGAAVLRPFTALPGLLRLNRNCRQAADQLGEFLANCEY